MSQAFASIDTAEVLSAEIINFDLAFIENVEYEFVGGGTAVNNY